MSEKKQNIDVDFITQLTMYGRIDTAADWQKVKRRLKMHESSCRTMAVRRDFFGRYSFMKGVAAVIALLMIVGAVHYVFSGSREKSLQQSEVIFNRIHVPAGQRSQMILADSTSVWLNSGSSLQVPVNFGTDRRQVQLEGEAFFEVSANKQKPFVVRTTGELEVKVYGTSLNLTSYSNDRDDEVVLLSGSLAVAVPGSGNEILLQPGQKIVYTRGERLFTGPMPADTEMEVAWRDGKLFFDNEPFGEIAKKLERRYGVTIRIFDKSIEQLRYRGAFRKESLEQAIQAIQFTAKYKYQIEDDIVTIF